jgi:hypothetical protein
MKKIEKLTTAQTSKMADYVKRWTEIGLSTLPANRPRAETAIIEMYRVAGLPAPKIVWCGSPMAQGLTRAIVLDQKLMKDVGKGVGDSAWDSVRASVGASVRDSVGASVYGQHDANWLAFYKFFRDECGLKEQTEKLSGLTELCESAGWALPHQKICWVSERHCVVTRDDRGRLHSLTGPALMYPDGWGVYAVHGTRIPETWITDPKSLTAKVALTWPNVEQRRAACEILGWENVLSELKAKTIDQDEDPMIGELVEVTIPDVGKEKFLRVLCGTGRKFALPVPPNMKTALEANSWTYGVDTQVLKALEART